MSTDASAAVTAPSKAALWTGRILSGLIGTMMLLDGVMKIVKPKEVVEQTVKMGYAEGVILPLGVVLTISAVLHLIPQTAVIGAILLTGYLGGAVDAHVRNGDPAWQMALPALFGVLIWIGLVLRDRRLRARFLWRD
ncbi:MAG: DoxX family protein [Planctomycetaceae bacterium]|nr:DoxX family protein [Planctomycetaceae bacterium]